MTAKERAAQLKDGISTLYREALATTDPAAWEAQMRLHVELAYCTGRADRATETANAIERAREDAWLDEMDRRMGVD